MIDLQCNRFLFLIRNIVAAIYILTFTFATNISLSFKRSDILRSNATRLSRRKIIPLKIFSKPTRISLRGLALKFPLKASYFYASYKLLSTYRAPLQGISLRWITFSSTGIQKPVSAKGDFKHSLSKLSRKFVCFPAVSSTRNSSIVHAILRACE